MKRASVRILALLCLCATIIAPPSTRVSAGAVTQTAADVQKLDATDVQGLDAATAFVRDYEFVTQSDGDHIVFVFPVKAHETKKIYIYAAAHPITQTKFEAATSTDSREVRPAGGSFSGVIGLSPQEV